MVSGVITILALASAVVAHPQRHRPWQHWGTDRLSAAAAGPTAPASPRNGTNFGGAPVEPPTATNVRTVTVNPVPLESSGVGSGNDFSSVSVPIAAVAPEGDSSTCITSTLTSTTVEVVTFTAQLAPQQTAPSIEGNGIGELAPETSVSLEASSVTAGAFYNRPTWGGENTYSYGGAPSSAPAVVPTTFATAVSSAPPAGGSSAAPVSSSVPSTGGGRGGAPISGKKGLSYNDASLTNAFAGKGISWVYNWAAGPGGAIVPGAEFVPMLWGQDGVGAWPAAAAAAIASGSKHVLSFNEPDHAEQARMDPQSAAKSHIANMNPLAGQVAIGSPAVTNGAGTNPLMGIDWLREWFKACGGQCKVDFVAFHWYDSANNFAYFTKHVQDVIDLATENGVGKVWLTEYGATGSDSDVASFISKSVDFLENTPAVEAYAYFMTSNGILVNGNSLSSLGTAYAG